MTYNTHSEYIPGIAFRFSVVDASHFIRVCCGWTSDWSSSEARGAGADGASSNRPPPKRSLKTCIAALVIGVGILILLSGCAGGQNSVPDTTFVKLPQEKQTDAVSIEWVEEKNSTFLIGVTHCGRCVGRATLHLNELSIHPDIIARWMPLKAMICLRLIITSAKPSIGTMSAKLLLLSSNEPVFRKLTNNPINT